MNNNTGGKQFAISVRMKFMLAYTAVIVAVIILCIFLFSNIYSLMSENASRSTVNVIGQIKTDIELFVNEADARSIWLYHSADTMRLIEESSDPEISGLVRKNILSAVKDVRESMGIEANISVLSSEMRILTSSNDGWIGKQRILGSYWINKISRAGGEKVIISGYNVAQGDKLENIKVISMARLLRSSGGENKGILLVDIPIDSIRRMCDRAGLGANGFIAVVDGDGYILYHTNDAEIGMTFRQNAKRPPDGRNYYTATINNRQMLVSETESVYTGFTMVGAVPKSDVEFGLNDLRKQFFLNMALIFSVAILFSWVIAYTITKPVIKMSREMKRVQDGDFSLYPLSGRNDEIGMLERSFNAMLNNLNEMIDRIYKLTIREKEAQYKALSAVIHPHFMYNTLEAIAMTAYINDDNKVVEMINQFAGILRYSIENTPGPISLRHELAHLENYIKLLKIRNDGLFDVEFNIDPGLLDCKIMKLTLQPIVENSLKYGFHNMEYGGLIKICAKENGCDFCIEVSDNGNGISTLRLSEINEALHDNDDDGKDFLALKNINERIRLNFGGHYGLYIRQNDGPGITVSLVLPRQRSGLEW